MPVVATPNINWRFDHWLIDGTEVVKTNSISPGSYSNHTLRAFFVSSGIPAAYLTTNTVGSGTVHTIWSNSTVTEVKSEPESGWALDHWELDGVKVSSLTTYNVTMNSNHVLTAVFKQQSVTSNTGSIPAYPFVAITLGIISISLLLNRFRTRSLKG
jgi:hypothetical protein